MRSPSIWLYGSRARGQIDDASDLDVLVVSDEPVSTQKLRASLRREIAGDSSSVAPMCFTWEEVHRMVEYGSLFLHHLRLEGRPLEGGRDNLRPLLATLPPYQRATQELGAFTVVLDDVRHSLTRPHSPAYELAVVATALRHMFILGCYVSGHPDFGRTTPFHRLCRTLGQPAETAEALATLYRFRLYQHERAAAPFSATTADVRHWLTRADVFLAMIRERVHAFDRTLHRAA